MESTTELDGICQFIREFHRDYPQYTKGLNVDLLMYHINDLNSIIGHDKLKIKIGKAVKTILLKKKMNVNTDPYVNFLLLGCPGVGKTTIATKIANIWDSAGFLDRNCRQEVESDAKEQIADQLLKNSASYFIAFTIASILATMSLKLNSTLGLSKIKNAVLSTVIFVASATVIIYLTSKKVEEEEKPKQKDEDCDSNIVLAKTSDFISSFYGKTPTHCDKFISKNAGKIIFYDEAYDLMEPGNMHYGATALTHIVRAMSESPTKHAFGFAGYKHKIKANLLNKQEGLKRRIPYVFVCEGYTGDELFKIFLKQLIAANLSLVKEDVPKCQTYFLMLSAKLTQYGGDTKNLVDLCNNAICEDWMPSHGREFNEVSYEQFRRSLDELVDDKLSDSDDESAETDWMDPPNIMFSE